MCKRTPSPHCGKFWSTKLTLSKAWSLEEEVVAATQREQGLPAVCIRWILTLGWLSLLAVCCVYSYTADGSFKTEKLKTGGSLTTKLFSESFLQFFHCQSQLKDISYGEVTHEKRTSTCMPGNFCVSPNIRSVTTCCGSHFWSVCFFHSAPCPLLPSPSSSNPPSYNIEQSLPTQPAAINPQTPSKTAAGLEHIWPILVPQPRLCTSLHPTQHTTRLPAQLAHEILLSRQQITLHNSF